LKVYEFLDKEPAIGRLVVIEGVQRVLAERALEALLDRLLPTEVRELNLSRFGADDVGDFAAVREAAQAMPFLAERRVVVVSETQAMRADPRRALLAVVQEAPDGNTLIVLDLLKPSTKAPQPFGVALGRAALRIDTTADESTRARFVTETLERLGAKAEPRAIAALAGGDADLAAVRNDLEKLALAGKPITLRDLQQEALAIEDPKPYLYASALVEGKTSTGLAIAHEFLAENTRGAVPLLGALATECGFVYELVRPHGRLPERVSWRERSLRPIARRIGDRRAQRAFVHVLRGIESVMTGRVNDPEEHLGLVDRISLELANLFER
jgi:DNA polymerase III delta subunit